MTGWACPVCGGTTTGMLWRVGGNGSEQGVGAEAFRPSSEQFGSVIATVLRCRACGHGAVKDYPDDSAVTEAYLDAVDPVSLREEDGQVETARRLLTLADRIAHPPGRLLDVGSWTGSLLTAARERGWTPLGVEPSRWAAERAAERGLEVLQGELDQVELPAGAFLLVTMCDVLEHLADPGAALDRVHALLHEGGALVVTVPDAGSLVARLMGRRWWSVLPMHLQYFSRTSMRTLLEAHGFEPVLVRTHPKTFSGRYYAERLSGYSDRPGRGAVRAVERLGLADRLITPDLRDRMVVIARRR